MDNELALLCEAFPPDPESSGYKEPDSRPTVREYVPHDGQAAFHALEQPFKLGLAGVGWGKTIAGTAEAYYHACGYNRHVPHLGLAGAPTYRMLADVKVPAYREFFPPAVLRGGSWDKAFEKSAFALVLKNGTKILFRSLENQAYQRIRGLELTWFDFDEVRLLRDREPFHVAVGRLRGPGLVRGGWGTTTPNGEDWVAEDFVITPKEGFACVRGKTSDNPHLPEGYEETLRSVYSRRYYDQEVLGLIVTAMGSVYSELSRDRWPDGNCLVYEPDFFAPTYVAVDFGRVNPRALLIQRVRAIHPQTDYSVHLDVVVGEWQEEDGQPPEDRLVREMAESVQDIGLRIAAVYGDPAGDSRNDQTYITSASDLCRRLGVPFKRPVAFQRSKEAGEELVAKWVRDAAALRRLVWATTGEEHPAGGLMPIARNSFKAHANLKYPEKKPGKASPTTSLKDGVNDHDTDALRYYLAARNLGTSRPSSTRPPGM